jgi:DNA-binding IclR family transcriptional regulator
MGRVRAWRMPPPFSRQAVRSDRARTDPVIVTPSTRPSAPSEKHELPALLRKAGAVLDCLADGELTPAAISVRIGEPRSTVYRLVANLKELELIDAGLQQGTYRLGLKLLRLGSTVRRDQDERQLALPVMEKIHDATGETVFLCIRRGLEAVCIERIDGKRVQSLALRLGGTLPLHAGAAPRVLLAYEPEELWDRYLAGGPLEAMTPKTPTTAKSLLAILRSVRQEGVSISDQDVTMGIAAIGVPILDFSGNVRAALSISGIRSEILGKGSRARELTVEGAATISRQLGFKTQEASSA